MKNKFLSQCLQLTLILCFSGACNFPEIHASKKCHKSKTKQITDSKKAQTHLLKILQENTINKEQAAIYINKLLPKNDLKKDNQLDIILNILIKNNNFPGILFLITHENTLKKQPTDSPYIKKLERDIQELLGKDPNKLQLLLNFLAESTNETTLLQKTYIKILVTALLKAAKNNKKIYILFKQSTTSLDRLYDAIYTANMKFILDGPAVHEKMAYKLLKTIQKTSLIKQLQQLKKFNDLLMDAALFSVKQDKKEFTQNLFEFVLSSPYIHENFYTILPPLIMRTSGTQKKLNTLCASMKTILKTENIGLEGKNKTLTIFISILKKLFNENFYNLGTLITALVEHEIAAPIIETLQQTAPLDTTLTDILKWLKEVQEKAQEDKIDAERLQNEVLDGITQLKKKHQKKV